MVVEHIVLGLPVGQIGSVVLAIRTILAQDRKFGVESKLTYHLMRRRRQLSLPSRGPWAQS